MLGGGWGGKGWLSLIKHLLCAREVANIVSVSPTGIFFRISCIFLKEILGLKEVNCIAIKLVSGRRRIQIQVHLAGKPTPFPSLPTYRFLQAYGVLVLFRNQENPHSED